VEQHLGTNAHAQYIHAHTYMHAYTYIHTCIHIHTYIHAHTYIHTYMYMHTYVHTCVLKRGIVVKTLVLDRQSLRDLFIMLFLYAQSALFFNIFSSKIYLSCQIFHFFAYAQNWEEKNLHLIITSIVLTHVSLAPGNYRPTYKYFSLLQS
jgi:hypothetical protein